MTISRLFLCIGLSVAVLATACSKQPIPPADAPSDTPTGAPSDTPKADVAAKCDGGLFNGQCVAKGDIVKFGNYPQATDTPEPISWIVLDVDATKGEEGKILLLSQYALDSKTYHEQSGEATWENCSLRKWLNEDFMNVAFNQGEQPRILKTHLDNPGNPIYNTPGGNPTDDSVFLLSLTDALSQTGRVPGSGKYFSSDKERKVMATSYAIKNGAFPSPFDGTEGPDGEKICSNAKCSVAWWVRTPGIGPGITALVGYMGDVLDVGNPVLNAQVGVRPAIWVRVD